MNDKVTKCKFLYPKGQEPDFCNPLIYEPYRFAIGKKGKNMLFTVCMNPSAASDDISDKTVNRVINASIQLGYDGWIVLNTYPERATNSANMDEYNKCLAEKNLAVIREYIIENEIKEVWGAWGNLSRKALKEGRNSILALFKELDVKVFHFAEPTKNGEPRHPTPRGKQLETTSENKRYYEF
ncbi:MAG TPA: hypothetical protein DIC60_05665 [Lachnospiraceae bacterium]|nr:hypothetical protein [Lachnospiraceae bacterium]